MPTACVNQPNCQVRLKSERLEIMSRGDGAAPPEALREIPLREIDRLIVVESTQITSQAMGALLRAGIPITLLDHQGRFLGGFSPATNAHGQWRLLQYERTRSEDFALAMAGRIVAAKTYNQRRVLQRLLANRRSVDPEGGPGEDCAAGKPLLAGEQNVGATLDFLDGMLASAPRCASIDELRGHEGAAAARYFAAWAWFLPEAFPFQRRSTRPPLNPVNACISFGATLVYSEAVSFIHAHGLDPALGLLHTTEDGRWSLALDLMEPFRPVLVEALALDLFSHKHLAAAHFEPKNGGVYLNEEGRKRFFLQYERRMERQFISECAGHRTTLRQQLEHQAVMIKGALEEPGKFEPFLMN